MLNEVIISQLLVFIPDYYIWSLNYVWLGFILADGVFIDYFTENHM